MLRDDKKYNYIIIKHEIVQVENHIQEPLHQVEDLDTTHSKRVQLKLDKPEQYLEHDKEPRDQEMSNTANSE